MRQEPKGEGQRRPRLQKKSRAEERRPEQPRQKPRRVQADCAAPAALRMLRAGQAKGILGGWGIICLLVSLLLQHPGVHSKCYFQAQGKMGRDAGKG